MGYQKSKDDPDPPSKIVLRSISKKDFELLTAFAYKPKTGNVIEVPIHPNDCAPSTDLASVPPLLWGLLPSYGRQLRAALLHDRLCDEVNKSLRDGKDPHEVYPVRRRSDDIFFEGMRDLSVGGDQKRVGWFRAKLFWVGVSYGRYWKFRKVRAALMTLQVLIGVLAVDLLVHVPPLPWLAGRLPWDDVQDGQVLAATWAVMALASIAWWRDSQVPFIGLLVGPLILPVLLVTFIAQLFLGLPDLLLHLFGRNQPPANFGPTATAVRRG